MGETVKSEVLEFLPWQLRKFTGEFSEETFLGKTQFGKLYRGRILDDANQNEAQTVTVKIWEDSMLSLDHPMENLSKLAVLFLLALCFLLKFLVIDSFNVQLLVFIG